jgi:hypothetical protein
MRASYLGVWISWKATPDRCRVGGYVCHKDSSQDALSPVLKLIDDERATATKLWKTTDGFSRSHRSFSLNFDTGGRRGKIRASISFPWLAIRSWCGGKTATIGHWYKSNQSKRRPRGSLVAGKKPACCTALSAAVGFPATKTGNLERGHPTPCEVFLASSLCRSPNPWRITIVLTNEF